jgi:hypothetical protein
MNFTTDAARAALQNPRIRSCVERLKAEKDGIASFSADMSDMHVDVDHIRAADSQGGNYPSNLPELRALVRAGVVRQLGKNFICRGDKWGEYILNSRIK